MWSAETGLCRRDLALAPSWRRNGAQGLPSRPRLPYARALASQIPGNPHDQYFKLSFGQPELAADLVAHYLPAEVVRAIDLGSLQPRTGSFVDDELRGHQGDLLFRARLADGGEGWVYLVFEHKSYPDPLVALQLLRYCLRIWEQDRRERPRERLRPIVPVVVYNGKRPWKAVPFRDLFVGPSALFRYWPGFDFELLDLAARQEEQIVGDLRVRVALLALRAIRDPGLAEQLPRICRLLRDLVERDTAVGMLQALLQYAASAGNGLDETQLRQAAEAALPDHGDDTMAVLIQQWLERGRQEGRHEGRQEGWQEGRQEGRQEGALLGLRAVLLAKFGQDGLALMPAIEAIEDPERLAELLERLPYMPHLEAARALIA